jgi:hypothetical protein
MARRGWIASELNSKVRTTCPTAQLRNMAAAS